MTVSHHADPVHLPSLAAALGALRARGLRISSARRLVLEALFAADGAGHRRGGRRPGSTGGCPRRISPPCTATSTRSRRSGWSGTSTSATAPGCTRWPATTTRATPRASAAAATSRSTHEALADDQRDACAPCCGFEAALAHFPIVGLCPECAR